MQRFVSIWFRHLATDWFSLQKPELKRLPFVLRTPQQGRMVITAVNAQAEANGLHCGMPVADASALLPGLQVVDDIPSLTHKLLHKLAEWCIRFTPIVAVDGPDGLMLDVTGCAHLWGGEEAYLAFIVQKLAERGYSVHAAMAGTQALAWGVARNSAHSCIVTPEQQLETLRSLPPEALRLDKEVVERLHKLGLHRVEQIISLPRAALRKRFGVQLLSQLDKALGQELEPIHSIQPTEPYQQRLPCMEPIVTATGIEIALRELLTSLCLRLQQEQLGLRVAVFKGYRVDGKIVQAEIGTHRSTYHVEHLFKLFELKLSTLEPALGIELFVLEASKVEPHTHQQEKIWEEAGGLHDERLSELMDRLATRVGAHAITRYVADEHHWPERSYKQATLQQLPATAWREDRIRPLHLLATPERIEVTAPIPDYPPLLFRYKGKLHTLTKADGPERIEQEWWLQQGQHRDYYRVEDESGNRYWLFRLGHYHETVYQWFIHGFFS
jgi:protein ImuB